MPRIEELHLRARDLYWQIEAWKRDYDISEEPIDDARRIAAKLSEELTRLYNDPDICRQEAEGAGKVDSDPLPLAARQPS